MAKRDVPHMPESFPMSSKRDGTDVSKVRDMDDMCPVGRCHNSHTEWHDSRTGRNTGKPDWACDD